MIYISGSITGTDDYMERFAAAERELTEAGNKVVNPTKVNAQMPKLSYDDYMRMAITMLDLCTDIYMLDGWESSSGAQCEYAYAKSMGLGIMRQAPKQEEKKYYWKMAGDFHAGCYLNICNGDVILNTKYKDKGYETQFTESEYKALAEKSHFPEDMFVKEKIE